MHLQYLDSVPESKTHSAAPDKGAIILRPLQYCSYLIIEEFFLWYIIVGDQAITVKCFVSNGAK